MTDMIFDGYELPFGYAETTAALDRLDAGYGGIAKRSVIGRSLLGVPIEMLSIGSPAAGERVKKRVLFIGTHHGTEHITANLLLMFAAELCGGIARHGRLGRFSADYIAARELDIVPMLNPDGAAIAESGLYWQSNARGVDLNHNYNAGFTEYKRIEAEAGIISGAATRYSGEYPESEPETEAICSLIRSAEPAVLVCLHTQGGELYQGYDGAIPRGSDGLARRMARRSGYTLAEPSGSAAFGGCKDWFVLETGRPGFTIECGHGENPLPPERVYEIYTELRGALLEAAAG